MSKRIIFSLLGGLFSIISVAQKNPAATGFDEAGSDAKAIQIADRAMEAMGGRKNWDKTHYIAWNFFGNRKLIWDKWSGNVRVDNVNNDQTVLLNINDGKGRVFKNGQELTQPDSVAKYVRNGKGAWINDGYWLLMPFKLKDSGVTLKYIGEEKTQDGAEADLLQLTFKGVGNTPDNKYKVWVNKANGLVWQWAYFQKFDAEKPNFIRPWTDYQKHGKILISGERGDRDLTDIKVFDKLPESIFTDFKRPDLSQFPEAN
ncbi:MAG: hypothetical protein U0X91_22005 [Spirosomataceae bacterium]